MADISKVRMLNGTEYNYKDAKARSDIEGLKADLGYLDGIEVKYNNLFDASTALDNKAIWSDGAVHDSADHCCSDFIDISGVSEFVAYGTSRIMFYTTTSHTGKIGEATNGDTQLEKATIEVPQNATYMRINVKMTSKDVAYAGNGKYDFQNYVYKETIANVVTYTAQSRRADLKNTARANINAQENLGVEYGSNMFDSNTVVADTVIYASDGIERERAGYFTSAFIDVSGLSKITVTGAE